MGPRDLGRVIARSLLVSLALGVVIGLALSASIGGGFAFGGVWSALNFWVMRGLLSEVVGRRRAIFLFLWVQGKLALYAAGAVVLLTLPASILAAVIGFHTPFVFALIESVRLQDKKPDTGMG